MPHLHYSNQLERLILPLANELNKRDPFDTIDIVVPNFNLEKWIYLKLAQVNGIAANLRFITLEKVIDKELQKNLLERKYTLLKPVTIQCLLSEILREKQTSSDPLWLPIRKYLIPFSSLSQEALERRIYQLAGRLTRLFLEYEFSRNDELLTPWLAGKNVIDLNPLGVENWQRVLWSELFGPDGKLTRYNYNTRHSSKNDSQQEIFSLTQIYSIYKNKENQNGVIKTKGNIKTRKDPLHVFGISYLSQFHQRALTELLANLRDLHVYTLNPCMEFWEDVKSLSESKAETLKTLASEKRTFKAKKSIKDTEIKLGELLQDEEDNPFLSAWGRPGRENIRLLNQWSSWNFVPWFVKTNTSPRNDNRTNYQQKNILHQMQEDILVREPRRSKSLGLEQDNSIMILACANPRREVEAVASLIWDMIRNDQNLSLNECAVIVNDMECYQNEIEQVFERTHKLPYHLIDGAFGINDRLGEAALALLGLCFTEYTRKDLFNLIKNPCFLGIFEDISTTKNTSHSQSIQIEKWLDWADELNIFYGIDREFQQNQGYLHLDQDTYNWEQAFRRMTLSEILSVSSDQAILSLAENQIAPVSLPHEWSDEAARFMLLIRSLIADTRDLMKWEMSGEKWAKYVQTLFKTYLRPIEEEDEEAFRNLLINVQTANDLDLAQENEQNFNFFTIYEFFKQKQQSSTIERGHYLAEGVTISSFQPMRPIPFKVVFLLGLGEGLFPTPNQQDTLDLRHTPVKLNPPIEGRHLRERRLGDVSVTERDRYMFLETLISTRKKLIMSYVSRNETTYDELNPSSIIQTLLDELNCGYLRKKFEIIQHPLKKYSLSYFPELNYSTDNGSCSENNLKNYDPDAFRQARVFRTRELFDQEFSGMTSFGKFRRIRPEWFSGEVNQILTEKYFQPPVSETKIEKDLRPVSLSRLRKFLYSPLQSTASYLLEIEEDEEETDDKVYEPLLPNRLVEWSLLREIWNNGLEAKENDKKLPDEPNWEEIYFFKTQLLELEGNMPSGIFKTAAREKHLRILKSWQKQLCEALKVDWESLKKKSRQYHFGPVKEGLFKKEFIDSHQLLPILSIKDKNESESSKENISIKFYGKTEWCYADQSDNYYIIYLSEHECQEKSWIRHFLDVLVLRVADLLPENVKIKGLCISAEGKVKTRDIKLPSKEKAKDYLFDLLKELHSENAAFVMPVESVLEISKENLSATKYNSRFNEWIKNKLNSPNKNKGISTQYGPIKYINDDNLPENAYELVTKRFQLYFELFSL